MDKQLLYHVKFKESSDIEGRIFLADEEYPVFAKDAGHVILCGENGEFCFSNELMAKAIVEWELTIKGTGKFNVIYTKEHNNYPFGIGYEYEAQQYKPGWLMIDGQLYRDEHFQRVIQKIERKENES